MMARLRVCGRFRKEKAGHNESGSFMVEMLVALFVGMILAGALVQGYAQIFSFGNKGQGELLATTIAQQVIDSARDTDFATLSGEAGVHKLPINVFSYKNSKHQDVEVYDGNVDPIFPRALLLCGRLGSTDLNWSTATGNNRFHGACIENIAVSPPVSGIPQPITIQVWVVWNESGDSADVNATAPPTIPVGYRSFFMQTTISQNGIHS